ncbi:MAG: 50S ribosomal protein L23 [Spirochaetota bacterium]
MRPDAVIIEPVMSEKTTVLREQGKYVFHVDSRANKIEVMNAVRSLFGVKPVSCNIVTVKRKPKRQRIAKGYTAAWKKAVVTLAEGDTIGIFEGV